MTSKKSKRALVIDDDQDLREVLTVILEEHDFEVTTVSDGIKAIGISDSFDVILLDLNMPVLDGAGLAEYWQLTNPRILDRVIVLTGYSRNKRGKNLRAFATIAKPFDHEELIRLVTKCAFQRELVARDIRS